MPMALFWRAWRWEQVKGSGPARMPQVLQRARVVGWLAARRRQVQSPPASESGSLLPKERVHLPAEALVRPHSPLLRFAGPQPIAEPPVWADARLYALPFLP